MPKPPPPPRPFMKPVQTEEVYDLGVQADNALTVNQILKDIVWEDLEDLGGEEIYSRKHSKKRKESDEQRETLKEVTQGIWSLLKRICFTKDLGSLQLSSVDTQQKQEALMLAIEDNKVNETFLWKFILRTWESVNDERKKKGQKRSPSDPLEQKKNKKCRRTSTPDSLRNQKPHELGLDTRTWASQIQPSVGSTTTDLQPHEVSFSSLTALRDNLIEKLAQPDFKVHHFKSYQTEIECFGSLQCLKDRIERCILPEVRQLEGQEITRHMLDNIHAVQDPLSKWPAIGGYLLYITSSEADEYWRPYVGQASLLIRRIPQHITEVLQGHIHTLCYWVASKPGRQLNFIRLWDITEEEDTPQSLELLNTLLEMIFCLGFQSLPQPTLARFLGPKEFSLRGLNVVSPLLQNITLSPNERAGFRQWLQLSPSPETQQFLEARTKELQKKLNFSLQPSSKPSNYKDIQGEFYQQITPYLCPFVRDKVTTSNLRQTTSNKISDKGIAIYLKQQGIEEHLWAFPFGSTEARIGFVLDFDIPSLQCDTESVLPAHFPLALRSIGFDKQNSLTWPFNFQAPFVPRKIKLAGPEDQHLRDINRQIIDNSNLQVIVLCGINAERTTILSSFKKITLTIGNASLEAFLQIEQSVVRRVYLKSLAPLSALYSDNWRSGAMVSLTIKVAACLTQTKGIQPFYFRSRVALSELVLIRLREERDETKMTIDSITDSIWSWLYIRGFKVSDIARLESIGGSISRGLLLAMITSPRRPKEPNRTPAPRAIPRNGPPLFSYKFTESQLREVKAIHYQKQAERNLEYGDSTKDLSEEEEDDLLQACEFSEDQKGVVLHGLAFESSIGPIIKRMTVKTAKNTPRRESLPGLFRPSKKKTNDTVPSDRRGKDLQCFWCSKPTYGEKTYPCWCEILQASLCQQCSIYFSHAHYLPILKSQILHLEIFCGFCGSLSGNNWRFVPGFGLPTCSPQCHAGMKEHATRPQAARQAQPDWARFQDQMPEKLWMTADLRQYFKEKFGLDTSREGLKAMTTKRNPLVAEP